jgi:glucosamine-phosphate N-acetyltransferase
MVYMIEPYKIRSVTFDDFDSVFELLKQLWSDKKFNKDNTKISFERGLQNDVYICAEDKGKVVGFCSMSVKNSLWEDGEIAYISEIIVDHYARGTGIGTQLIQSIIELANERGCMRIELDSAFHRNMAHQFYESLGFDKRAYLFSLKLHG